MRPHPGVGRLLALLDKIGYLFHPVGVSEDDDSLVLNFGAPFHLTLPDGLGTEQRDYQAADQVMGTIKMLLP